MEKQFRVECVCKDCGEFLMGSNEKPHLTATELHKKWIGMVTSAPLNAPKCPKCGYSTDRDYNAGVNFIIDDGEKKMTSDEWFKIY